MNNKLNRNDFAKLIKEWKVLIESSEEHYEENSTHSIGSINEKVVNISKRLYFELGITDSQCLTANKVTSNVTNIYQGLTNYINKTHGILEMGKENQQIINPEDFLFVKKGSFISNPPPDLRGASKAINTISSMDTDDLNPDSIEKIWDKNTNESKKLTSNLFEFKIADSGDGGGEYFEPNDAYSAIINHPSINERNQYLGAAGNITFMCPDGKHVMLKMAELEVPPGQTSEDTDGEDIRLKVFISNNYVILLGIDLFFLAYGPVTF